jgi:hypothetical protein
MQKTACWWGHWWCANPRPPPRSGRRFAPRSVVEDAAVGRDQWLRAVQATTHLVQAAVEAGWTCTEMAPHVGVDAPALRTRVRRVRRPDRSGLDLTPAPPRRGHVAPPLPVEERQWLPWRDARLVAGVSSRTLHLWFRQGFMPNTIIGRNGKRLYARTDLDRIAEAPRRGAVGVSWSAVRDAVAVDR